MTSLWVVVLAAGEGRRLSALTADSRGVRAPKQFCSFGRERSMLQWALDRARSLAPDDRIVTVVAEEHRSWWEPELRALPPRNVVVQPENRGTAAGVLLPTIEILKRDPAATVVLLPSDHFVADEATLRSSVERAIEAVAESPDQVVLLGITPDEVETEYGWILPADRRGTTRPVERFVEKPSAPVAAELLQRGAVWNSFVLVAKAGTLLHLYQEALPQILEPFLRDLVVLPRSGSLESLYSDLPVMDFSRDVLETVPDRLALLVVPPCGWTDLGTPERVRRFVGESRSLVATAPSV